ncbi:Cuticular protein 47Ef [Carabus blaptoides fortunei]
MKLFIIAAAVLVGVCFGDRLENTYLPPSSSYSAGGSGNFLLAPRPSFGGSSLGGRSAFGASGGFGHGSHAIPSTSYGVPVVQTSHNSYNTRAGPQIPILKLNSDNNGLGNYRYEYETGNGIEAHEIGQLKNAGSASESNDVHGSYTYTGTDGVQYTVSYTADENGFHPQGAHLPTPPPIPEAILKSLQFNAAEEARHGPSAGQYNTGAYQQGPSPITRQYLAPRKPSFSQSTGYNY